MTVKEYLEITKDHANAYQVRPRIRCADGFSISVQGGTEFHYCEPRQNCNLYWSVELGYPSHYDEMLVKYAEDPSCICQTVFGFVPLDVVETLIEKHGGIDFNGARYASELHRGMQYAPPWISNMRKWAKND